MAVEDLALSRSRGCGATDQPAVLVAIHEDAPVERSAFAGLLRAPLVARVSCLWIGSDARLLPDACRAVADVETPAGELRLRVRGGENCSRGIADLVSVDYADGVCGTLAAGVPE